jgi:hypothetical protein
LALQAALDGHTEMTPDLTGEYSIKRPLQYEQMQRDQIEAAINGLAKTREEESTRRAEITPSPDQLRRQISDSRAMAASVLRLQSGQSLEEA